LGLGLGKRWHATLFRPLKILAGHARIQFGNRRASLSSASRRDLATAMSGAIEQSRSSARVLESVAEGCRTVTPRVGRLLASRRPGPSRNWTPGFSLRCMIPSGTFIQWLCDSGHRNNRCQGVIIALWEYPYQRHSKAKGELDEPTYNVRRDGVGSNILLLTWI
jgi:hypothetical protein